MRAFPSRAPASAGFVTPFSPIRFTMFNALIAAFSLSGWFSAATHELLYYFNHMNTTQWGIVAACAVSFGFLCLKGTGLNR